MPEVQLSNGMTVHTYEPPPADFDPRTAPDSLLRRYGFPARPDPHTSPEWRKLWEDTFSQKLTYCVPTFTVVEGVKRGVPRGSLTKTPRISPENVPNANAPNPPNPTVPNSIWAGSGVFPPAGDDSFAAIIGEWIVPKPYVPPGSTPVGPESFWALEWIGLDGYDLSTDILQVGTGTNASPAGLDVFAWWSWQPGNNQPVDVVQIDKDCFPVEPGDLIFGAVTVNSPTSGTIELAIPSRQKALIFTVTPPKTDPPTSLVGNCAEWIVERPLLLADNSRAPLCDYGVVYFRNMNAVYDQGPPGSTQNPGVIDDLGLSLLYTDNNIGPISDPQIEGQNSMEVVWRLGATTLVPNLKDRRYAPPQTDEVTPVLVAAGLKLGNVTHANPLPGAVGLPRVFMQDPLADTVEKTGGTVSITVRLEDHPKR